jgi:E3 ubiquitin-protein ligase mind-bomb
MNEECLKGMRQSATIGSIIGFDEDHDVVVMYPSGNRWTFNAAALTKVNNNIITPTTTVASIANPSASLPSSPQEYSFSVGSTVKISEDLDYVRQLQKGHGEWADGMAMV